MLGEAQNLPNGGEPAKVQIKGCYCEKANRHPHWWRRRPRPQLGH